MNKYSFLYPITLALFVPLAHAMEKDNPINPNVFTQESKEYMEYAVDLWVDTAEFSGITTKEGLAAIFKNMKTKGVDHLINDQEALQYANVGFAAMQKDPVFATLHDLQKINTYTYDGAKQLVADVSRVVTQAVAMNVLVAVCPDFKAPSKNLIAAFASEGIESMPSNVDFLELNKNLNLGNAPYISALTLIMGYLAQTGAGR